MKMYFPKSGLKYKKTFFFFFFPLIGKFFFITRSRLKNFHSGEFICQKLVTLCFVFFYNFPLSYYTFAFVIRYCISPIGWDKKTYFFKNGSFPASFSFFVFSIAVDKKNCFYINFADGWIRTADLWNRKRLLSQLSHNHCPENLLFTSRSYS